MQVRRKTIFTYAQEITAQNIVSVLNSALLKHLENAARMKFLYDFEAGVQPIRRVKLYRRNINIQCVDNVAHEVTKFHVGYEWGNPITLIQRGEKDSGAFNSAEAIAISLLNEQYEAESIKTKTQQLGKDVTICNLGYTHVGINMDWEEGDSFFTLNVLNPFTTFLVRSAYYLDRRPVMAVTYRVDDNNVEHFTCYTKESRFEVCEGQVVFEEMNPLGRIPIVEWIGNYDGMGIWEHQISEMDNLNLMVSDFSNTVEQNMQCIWHTNDVDFPVEITKDKDGNDVETVKKPKDGDWFQTFTPPDGKTPIVEPLSVNYDYSSMLENILTRRQLILQKCYCPQRNDDSGGSTGIAMQSAAGWSALDVVAESIQACQESAKMEEVKLVLAAIHMSPYVAPDNPLLALRAIDVQPNIKRMRLSEIATKVNAFATMVSHGVYGLHALVGANIFPDNNQVWADSKELIERYQNSVFGGENEAVGGEGEQAPNAGRIMQDMSDQVGNSPFVGL